MKLIGSATLAEVYYSEQSDKTYLTVVPTETGGLLKVSIPGRVEGISLGGGLAFDTSVKPTVGKYGLQLEVNPAGIKKS